MAIGFKMGKAALALNPSPAFGLTSAAHPEMLPQPKPRAVREHFVVPPIRSRDGDCIQRPNIRCLKLLNIVADAFNVHSVSISDMSLAIVKRSGGRVVGHFEIEL